MSIFCEKFGWTYDEYMHTGNYMILDLMLVDSPRMLSEKEKEKLKKKKVTVKVNSMEEMEKEMKKMFG